MLGMVYQEQYSLENVFSTVLLFMKRKKGKDETPK